MPGGRINTPILVDQLFPAGGVLSCFFRVLLAFVRVISWIVRLVQLTNDPRNHAKTTKGINTKKTSLLQTEFFKTL